VFAGLKVRMQCPLVLLVKVGFAQGKAFESEEGSDMGSGNIISVAPESSGACALSYVLCCPVARVKLRAVLSSGAR
jgi:hypothetical protein